MSIDWKRLTEFFPAQDIEWKPGATTRDKSKGLAMAYITARAVQQRLDDVFGPGGWKNEFRAGPEGGVLCRIYFRNDDGEWVWREDGADNSDVEAVKGGLSNAMKRAGAALGIGRYLYDMPSQWVPLNDRGRFAEVPRIPIAFLPNSDRRTDGPPPQTVAQALAESDPPGEAHDLDALIEDLGEVLTRAQGQALVAFGESLNLNLGVVLDTIESFRNEEGGVPAAAEPAIRAALTGLVP